MNGGWYELRIVAWPRQALVGLVATRTDWNLSRFASVTVCVLIFASFAGFRRTSTIRGPSDPQFERPGRPSGILSAAAPVFLPTMVYQDIVLSVNKMID